MASSKDYTKSEFAVKRLALVHRSIGTAYQIELCNGGLENPVEIRPASSLDQKCHERFTYSPI